MQFIRQLGLAKACWCKKGGRSMCVDDRESAAHSINPITFGEPDRQNKCLVDTF